MGRTMAAVLFTDLVRSTELRGRLGEEAADEVRRKHDQLLSEAVTANSGSVVKGLGDGVMATFAGASDAVVAAVAIQQAVDRLNRSGKTSLPVAVRVGLSAGDVAFEDEDVHGTPVIEASRLCAAAGGGEILVAEVVRLLTGTADHDLVDRGSLELKGLQTPVSAWEVRWERAAASAIPMPALLTHVGRIFVGRDDEVDRLGQLWKEAAAGERRVALLGGEPGVGKTRLAAELAIRVHDEGGVVLAGRCDEDLGVPYQPVVEALRHFVAYTPTAELGDRLGRYGGEIARLVPELADHVADLPRPLQSDPETERYRLFEAVTAWLMAVSAEEPLLLVLDDLQWATKPTLLLLRHIVSSPGPMRLLVVGIYRDTELGRNHALVEVLADVRRQGGVHRLLLRGLNQEGVDAYLEAAAGHDLADDDLPLARAIHQQTDGNPFFLCEILRHLAETDAFERQGDRWAARLPVEELGVPEGIREVVGRRLSRMSEEANQTLRLAAVVGEEFEVPLLHLAGDLSEEALLCALEEVAEARVVTETGTVGRYRFSHALVRDTLYDEISAARRAALHGKVTEAIERVHAARLDDYLPALAHHCGQASGHAGYSTRGAVYATRAGDQALAQLAPDEAAGYYRRALELLDMAEEPADERARIDLLIALGEAEHRSGEPGYRPALREAAERAEQLGDADRLARAALAGYPRWWNRNLPDENRGLGNGDGGEVPYTYSLTVDRARVTVLEAALRARADREDVMRARLLSVLASELGFADERCRRRELSDQALAMTRRLGDLPALARVLLSRCVALWDPAMLEERRANASELSAVAGALGDPFFKVWAAMFSFETALESAEVEEADRHLEDGWRAASDVGLGLRWFVAFPRVGRVLLAGRLQEADALARETLELGLATQRIEFARMTFGVQRYQIRLDQGRLDQVVSKLVDALERSDHPEPRSMLAEAYCELDRWDEARSAFEPLTGRLSDLPMDPNWIVTMTRSASVCAQLGDTSTAATLYGLLSAYSGRVVGEGVIWTGTVDHYLGILATVLGDPSRAQAHFVAAEIMHTRIGAPTWLARTRLEWARMLLTHHQPGDVDRVNELLGQALDTARELGLANVERRAVELLR